MTAHSELKTALINKLTSTSTFDTNISGGLKNITAASGTSTISITCASHGLTAGDFVVIASVVGMTDINGLHKVVSVTNTNVFTISKTTSQTYISGGTIHRKAVFYYRAEQGIEFPYCVFQFFSDVHSFDSGNEWERVFIQFSLFDNHSSSSNISTLESNLIDLLKDASLTFSNYTQILFQRQNKRYFQDEDNIWQTIIEYVIELEHN